MRKVIKIRICERWLRLEERKREREREGEGGRERERERERECVCEYGRKADYPTCLICSM